MKTTTVNIRQDYTLGELYWEDVQLLQQLVARQPDVSTNIEKGYTLMCITLGMAFKSYRKSIPKWKLFSLYKYWRLSQWKFLKRVFPSEAILMFNEAFQTLQPKTVKKK